GGVPLRPQPLQQALPAEVLVRDAQDPVLEGHLERVAFQVRYLERGGPLGGEHRHRAADEPYPQPGDAVELQLCRSLDPPLRHRAHRHSTRLPVSPVSTPNDISHFPKVKMYRDWDRCLGEMRGAETTRSGD